MLYGIRFINFNNSVEWICLQWYVIYAHNWGLFSSTTALKVYASHSHKLHNVVKAMDSYPLASQPCEAYKGVKLTPSHTFPAVAVIILGI